jgi:hypothetical protein
MAAWTNRIAAIAAINFPPSMHGLRDGVGTRAPKPDAVRLNQKMSQSI